MWFVQTNNNKEQSSLEEEFSKQDNLFIVPIKKTSQIGVILEGILFQVFGQASGFDDTIGNQASKISQKVQKMCKFINNTLKLNFSLSLLREIFEIIKTEEKKIRLYEQYILQMNKRLMIDDDEDQQIFNRSHHQDISMDLQNKFREEFDKRRQSKVNLEQEIAGIQLRIEAEARKQQNKKQRKLQTVFQISCDTNSPKNQSATTMHTLKSQFTTHPNLQNNFLSEYKIGQLNYQYENEEQSFNSQKQTQLSIPHTAITNSQQKIEKNFDNYFYCPGKKQKIRSLVPEKKLNDSKFIQNLSGRLHPLPSFLHDESIGQMILKEKKQDLRKSKILKNSIKGIEQNRLQNAYMINLRQIKYQNKIKRSSKNLLSKKDIKEVKQDQKQTQTKEINQKNHTIKKSQPKSNYKQKRQIQYNNKEVNFFKSQIF